MKKLIIPIILLLFTLLAAISHAGQIRAYVAEFKVSGGEQPADTAQLLKELLSSRLSGDSILVVDSASEADILVSGRYTLAGGQFSLDSVAREKGGKVIARDFVEGENQGELLRGVGRLAARLAAQITANGGNGPVLPKTADRQASPGSRESGALPLESTATQGVPGWRSQRLSGNYRGIARVSRLPGGERELILAGSHGIKLFRQGKELRQVAEVSFRPDEDVLGVESADLDGDGRPEAYVTIFNGDALVSQVWGVKGDSLVRLAERLPYYFRTIAMEDGSERLHAQEMSLKSDFFGGVREVSLNNGSYVLTNTLKLPKGANIYNFSRFRDSEGRLLFLLLDEDGHLRVIGEDGNELWQSRERYGGSELFFKRVDLSDTKFGSDQFRWIFLQQRIFVSGDGTILIPQNSGAWNTGRSRSFDSNRMIALRWNGSALEKSWQSKERDNYLADYFYDRTSGEMVTLEIVKREGMFDKGASVVSVTRAH